MLSIIFQIPILSAVLLLITFPNFICPITARVLFLWTSNLFEMLNCILRVLFIYSFPPPKLSLSSRHTLLKSHTHPLSRCLCVFPYDMCVFLAQGKYLSSRQSWTAIRRRRRRRLWRRSSHLWQLAKMLGEPGEIAVRLHHNKPLWVWSR